jgi:transglutaminase-like putative cysteine protease
MAHSPVLAPPWYPHQFSGIELVEMTIFSVHHTTTYRYKQSVRPGQHQLLFRPRDSFDQRLLECHLAVVPEPAEVRWIHDVFGNCLTLVDFATSSSMLKFETTIRLQHTPENAPDFRIEDYARSHPFVYHSDELPDLAAYIRRHHPQDTAVDGWLAKFVTPNVSRPTGQLLMTLNEAIAEGFSYRRRTSRGTQTPGETLRLQHGTCRDFALLMMEAGLQRALSPATSSCLTAIVLSGLAAAPRMLGARSTYLALAGSSLIQRMELLEIET